MGMVMRICVRQSELWNWRLVRMLRTPLCLGDSWPTVPRCENPFYSSHVQNLLLNPKYKSKVLRWWQWDIIPILFIDMLKIPVLSCSWPRTKNKFIMLVFFSIYFWNTYLWVLDFKEKSFMTCVEQWFAIIGNVWDKRVNICQWN